MTFEVVALKVIEVFPAGIVTDPGTVADCELLDKVIANPPVGAAELIVTVPVLDAPPLTDVGLRASDLIVGALTVKVAVWLMPLREPVSVATV